MRGRKIRVSEVARLLEKSDLTIREGIKRGFFEFGVAIQLPGCTKYNYTISPAKLAEHEGISVEELYRRIEEIRKVSA